MPDQTIKYFIPGYLPIPPEIRIDNDSSMTRILEHFISLAGPDAGLDAQIAYLPKVLLHAH